ncbi:hypothetical protein EJ06DRAFT_41837 [Trichodelitschia bisporula]|uniref:Uncharacterized protein n=1 Tax=Trichodelitschia bisporula TaxID=703511 RepID=A0A6G1HW73_9PEZI|nr:hypothetical protein EJ06DRAFT_41837 [Trichodelitschia bisporula]
MSGPPSSLVMSPHCFSTTPTSSSHTSTTLDIPALTRISQSFISNTSAPHRVPSNDLPSSSLRLLRRLHTGRISGPPRPSTGLALSDRNREAIWEAATQRSYPSQNVSPRPQSLTSDPSSIVQTRTRTPLLPRLLSTPEPDYLQLPAPVPAPLENAPAPSATVLEPNLEPGTGIVNLPGTPPAAAAEAPPEYQDWNSMEFMMPVQYGHYGAYPAAGYQSNYADAYSTSAESAQHQQHPTHHPLYTAHQVSAAASPQPTSSYAGSYHTTPTPPAHPAVTIAAPAVTIAAPVYSYTTAQAAPSGYYAA